MWVWSPEQQRELEAKWAGDIRKCVKCAAKDRTMATHTKHEKHDRHGIHVIARRIDD